MTVEELQAALPKRDFWHSDEIAKVIGIDVSGVQRAMKKHNVGRIFKRGAGATGIRVYVPSDLEGVLIALNRKT